MRAHGTAATILGAVVTVACGGSPSPTATATPAPTPTPVAAAPIVLDGANFDALVLASGRPCLVEFQLPT